MSHPAKTVTVGGLDPGPRPGSCILTVELGAETPGELVSCTTGEMDPLQDCDYLAVERYVIQPRSGRSQDKGAQAATLVMAEEWHTRAAALLPPGHVQYLGPGNVKPWATDRRLERYGVTVRGGHHRDAVRHALYFAVRLGLLPRR